MEETRNAGRILAEKRLRKLPFRKREGNGKITLRWTLEK
jgi:hypothetical protein